MWVTVALVVTVVAALLLSANSKPRAFPPGPFGFPFFGNALYVLFKTPKISIQNYAETYGGVFSFRIFSEWVVLVSDPGLMKSALADPIFSGRNDLILFTIRDQIITGGDASPLGIMSTSGEVWKSQRQFTLRTLKDLGLGGRQTLEPIMQSEMDELIQHFTQHQNTKMDIGLVFNSSIVNVIWALVIGKRFSHSDAKLVDLVDKVNRMMQTFNPFHPALRFRWVKKMLPNLDIIKKTEGYMKDLLTFIEEELALHAQETGGVDDGGSYVGAYQQAITDAATHNKDSSLTLAHLKANILELFIAGSETTASTVLWAIYLLASNQEVQQAMQEELDRVVGPDNLPTLSDMDSLPYSTATIYEVQRVADLVPLGIPHQTMEDTAIGGYSIPKGTAVMFNLSHGLKDPKYWEAPDQFRPHHFLTDDGKVFKPDHFMPFGSGKRVCLGESLARLELFYFLTTLIHQFSWRLSDDPVVWEKHIIFNRPPNFTVLATSRSGVHNQE